MPTDAELNIDALVLYMEAAVEDLCEMFVNLPPEEFGSENNRRSIARLRGVAVTTTAVFLAASEKATTKENPCR